MRCGVTEGGTESETILVIGYGNELRGDDGIGPRVAAAANFPGVRVRSVCQLVPELAAEMGEVQMVIFVDALADPKRRTVELVPLTAEEIAEWNTHTVDPRTLLALTRAVYKRAPRAWLLSVPGDNFDVGEGLTPFAEDGVRRAVALLERILDGQETGPQRGETCGRREWRTERG